MKQYRGRAEEYIRLFVERADDVMADSTVVYDFVPGMLAELRERRVAMGIVTQKFKTRIDTILERDGLEGIFDVVVGADTVSDLKPHPGGLLSAVAQLGFTPPQALYVGDSKTDAETARRACVRFLPVLTGVTPREAFDGYDALGPARSVAEAAEAGGYLERRRMIDPNTPDILKAIVDAKREEVERLKSEAPIALLEGRIEAQDRPLNFAGALMGSSVRVIAEVKRASPTRGVLRADFDPAWLAKTYADGGAAAVSVLTNAEHFQGSIEHLEAAHNAVRGTGVPGAAQGVHLRRHTRCTRRGPTGRTRYCSSWRC